MDIHIRLIAEYWKLRTDPFISFPSCNYQLMNTTDRKSWSFRSLLLLTSVAAALENGQSSDEDSPIVDANARSTGEAHRPAKRGQPASFVSGLTVPTPPLVDVPMDLVSVEPAVVPVASRAKFVLFVVAIVLCLVLGLSNHRRSTS